MNSIDFGQMLGIICQQRGVTAADLSACTGVSDCAISFIINGKNEGLPHDNTIKCLAEYLGFTYVIVPAEIIISFGSPRATKDAFDSIQYPPGHIKPLWVTEKECIITALKASDHNRIMAAKALGIPVRTLYRKLKVYGLKGKSDATEHNNNQ